MRFDNAFQTVNGDVGMQFVDKGITLTVYKDKKGNLITSEHATSDQSAALILQYNRRRNWYKKGV